MRPAMKALERYMLDGMPDNFIQEIEAPDIPLWAMWTVQQYAKYEGRDKCFEKYGQLLIDIVNYIEEGGHPNLRLDDNGLL